MGGKGQSRSQFLSPGPGAYDEKTNAIKSGNGNVKFGSSVRGVGNEIKDERPGPGMYS